MISGTCHTVGQIWDYDKLRERSISEKKDVRIDGIVSFGLFNLGKGDDCTSID